MSLIRLCENVSQIDTNLSCGLSCHSIFRNEDLSRLLQDINESERASLRRNRDLLEQINHVDKQGVRMTHSAQRLREVKVRGCYFAKLRI